MSIYVIGFAIVFSIVLITYSLWPSSDEEGSAIKRRMLGRTSEADVSALREKAKESVAKKVADKVAPIAGRTTAQSAEDMSKLRRKLETAGYRSEHVATVFLASKTIVAVALGIAATTFVWASGKPIQTAAGIVMIAAGAGFMAPNLWLKAAMASRGKLIRQGLPDTLDMLVISVEAGLGLDAALQRVGEEMGKVHPVISEELQIVAIESQMGIPRSEALTNLAVRSGIEEMRSVTSVINQAERFGSSIARALRNQSDALRIKRRQAAEERAQKTTVKLMLPLIMFIFPAIMVVLGGPAGLKMMDTLGDRF